MRRLKPLGVLILIPAVCLCFSAAGCGKKEEPPAPKNAGKKDGGGGKKKATEMTELDTKDWGKLSGTVTYEGDPPPVKEIDMSKNKDVKQCHDSASEREKDVQTWLVDKKSNGVSDVVIFLKAPEGKYFKIHESYKKALKEPVLLHQPHCAFIPHSFPYWASSYDKDSGEQKRSGKEIKVFNDAQVNHNTAWSESEENPKGSVTLAPEKFSMVKFDSQDTPVHIKCDIHGWMSANCWALDNPYAARTDKEGKFVIENVPAGAEVQVVVWHEGAGYVYGKGGKTMKLEKGDNSLNFKVKAK